MILFSPFNDLKHFLRGQASSSIRDRIFHITVESGTPPTKFQRPIFNISLNDDFVKILTKYQSIIRVEGNKIVFFVAKKKRLLKINFF